MFHCKIIFFSYFSKLNWCTDLHQKNIYIWCTNLCSVHRPSTKKNWSTDHHHPPPKTPHRKEKQPPKHHQSFKKLPPTNKPPLATQMTTTINQKSKLEKPKKKKKDWKNQPKDNHHQPRKTSTNSDKKPKKQRTYSQNLSPAEARSNSHQKLKIVVKSKVVQERREEGFVQKKYDEVGSADDGGCGRSMGGQWCEMGGDERVVAL